MKKIISAIILMLTSLSASTQDMNLLRKLQIAEYAISNFYVDDVDEEKLVENAIRGMLETLDPHSTYSTADVISTYSFRMGIQNGDYGIATAAGLFEAVIALILVVIANKVSKRLTETALW